MRKGQNRKVNNVGKVGCLGLGLLAMLFACPMMTLEAWAYYDSGDGPTGYGNVGTGGGGTVSRASTVSIAFSPSAGEASVSPVTEAGVAARTMVLATVGVQNSGGYAVYLKSDSQNLTGKKTGEVIAPITGSVTYTNLATNTWGYVAAEGATVADMATYRAVSTSGNGALVGENKASNIVNESKTFALSFAAKIGSDKPADTYENQVMLSVVSAPLQVAGFSGIQTMQEMTTSVCSAAEIGDEVQLRDTRDGKMYWVSKLADGKCWMTQNLDLDLSTAKYLSPSDSDVTSNWTPGFNTATAATSSTVNLGSQTETRSWSLGDYRITSPNTPNSCGSGMADIEVCADNNKRFTPYTTPTSQNGDTDAHYIVGNHYQWNAATAGTGSSITAGTAPNSICSKGWRLPTSAEYMALVTELGGISNTDNATKAPFYGVRGGVVFQDSDLFERAGISGFYWSSTPLSTAIDAYSLYFYGTGTINSSGNYSRRSGLSVRCVAR